MNIKLIDIIKEVKNEAGKLPEFNYDKGNTTCFQRWLKETNSPYQDLFHAINIKQNVTKLLFKYKDFEKLFYNTDVNYHDFWNMYDGIYRECRGLVYDIKKEEIVALPFPKFFNIDEQPETSSENIQKLIQKAERIEFSDKMDGTLIISRWYENEVFSCLGGTLEEKDYIIRYAKKHLDNEKFQKLLHDYEEWTVLFECISPNNQLVVVYSEKDYGLHLIGMRNVKTGELKPYSEIEQIARKYEVPVTEKYNMTFDEILQSRKNFKHTDKEGYVMFLDGMLVKIKCEDYLLLHKMMRRHISKNAIIKAVVDNTIDDMIAGNDDENIQKVIYETLEVIQDYVSKMEAKIQELYENAPKEKVDFFKYANELPKPYSKYVKFKYQNQPYSVLVEFQSEKAVSYVRYADIEKRLELL